MDKVCFNIEISSSGLMSCAMQVFVYYRAMSRPIAKAQIAPVFSGSEAVARTNSHFISALCWKPKSEKKTLLAANSQGSIKVLQLNC